MVRLAVAGRPHLVASDYEFSLPRPSFTYQTLCRLKEDFPTTEFSLLIGGDNWASFDRWYRNEEVLHMASLYVYPREGQPIDTHLPRGVHQLDAPFINISSTSVRERVANGEEIATLVPKAVADYIVCQRLYQSEAKGG